MYTHGAFGNTEDHEKVSALRWERSYFYIVTIARHVPVTSGLTPSREKALKFKYSPILGDLPL